MPSSWLISPSFSSAPKRFLVLALTFSLLSVSGTAERPPNIIVVMADDQGWGDLSAHGHPSIQTPHLDSLAQDGAQFSRFYVQPVCAPTRAEFLTGRYHLRGGVTGVSEGLERIALREETIADVLSSAGYATATFGKWHSGSQFPYHPNGRGFQEFYGFTSGHWGSYWDAMMDHNGQVETGQGFMADDITNHTIKFMRDNHSADRPFFTFLAFNTPHSPMQVPDEFFDRWADKPIPSDHRFARREKPEHTRAALAMVENLDHNVGRILEAIDELSITESTIVVFLTDNGPNGARWNGDFKGQKGSTDEGGVRSPLFLRWPGQVPAGHIIAPRGAVIDLLPTLLDLAQVDHTPKNKLDGRSFASSLRGESTAIPERLIFSHWRDRVSVRGSRWMLDYEGELFDLSSDPRQEHPVTQNYPEITSSLQTAVTNWRADIAATGADQHPPMIVGDPGTEFTPLPARDANLHGNLKRSNKFPNCSYVLNWQSAEDYLSWEVDIPADGRFEVVIYYTCAVEDVGSEFSLHWQDRFVGTRVIEAWNPPATGAEHDRFIRQESYVKVFKPLSLGEIDLPAGSGPMTLRVDKVLGQAAGEFRLLTLRRVP